ncbi:MAG: PAS domain S-box protein [Candidatus Cloacimonetes bacterium]|nr:PAS domain S-box protein [Candidatus Cloacimonadota bacterium]
MFNILMCNKYKISISIIFGLIGFYVNFHTIIFPFGEYTAAILLGLLFPILITLSWGWKYGLLSAVFGGCQTMWWLWGASNGYAIFLVVPPFTLWIVWHGIFASIRKKQKVYKWWLSMYVVEIPFRILSSINLLTLSRWAITHNPPTWIWGSNAPNTIPLHFSFFVTIKQAAVSFVILLLADVLLNIKPVRNFFKLKVYIDYKKTGFIINIFLLLGCLFWLLDSIFYSFAFHKESSFIELLALNIPDYNIFIRTVIFIFCIVSGLITFKILRRQREGEIALKESEKKYRLLVEQSGQIMYDYDILSGKINWSGDILTITGWSLEEFQKVDISNWEKLIHNDDRKNSLDLLNNAMKKCSNYQVEYRFKRKDGKYFDIDDSGIFLADENGKAKKMLGLMKDITERKQAEKQLQANEERFRQVVESAEEWVWEVDDTALYTYASPIVEKLLGYKPEEIVGKKHSYDLFYSDDIEPLKKATLELFAEKKPLFRFLNRNVHKNGKIVWLSTSGLPIINDKGDLVGYRGTDIDITEQKKAETELQKHRKHLEELIKERTAELEEKNMKLEEFNDLFVGREFRIKELKDKVKELEKKH